MYIVKNALKSLGRSKGRNVLIGIIALVIAVSSCLGLSIRQAAESAKATTLDALNITGTISYDRSSMMNNIMGGGRGPGGGFDRDQFSDMMGNASSLTLGDYEKYAQAESVQDFYYTLTAAFNGTDELLPVTDEEEDDSQSSSMPGGFGGMGFPGMGSAGDSLFSSSDFSVIGYSSDSAMTSFVDRTSSILEGGSMFTEGTTEYECVISEELALFNDLSVGDIIVITNPTDENETYELTVTGIYTSSANNDFSMSMFGKSQDPANQIYMSAAALQTILDASAAADENTDKENETEIKGTVSATYVFADTEKCDILSHRIITNTYTKDASDHFPVYSDISFKS